MSNAAALLSTEHDGARLANAKNNNLPGDDLGLQNSAIDHEIPSKIQDGKLDEKELNTPKTDETSTSHADKVESSSYSCLGKPCAKPRERMDSL